jgi:hypothetical protein
MEQSNGAGPETLRGGSWINNQRNARVSNRNNNHPDNFNNNIGFRVLLAPGFHFPVWIGSPSAKLWRYGAQPDDFERQRGPVPVA